jgi:hypothetical protein
MSNRSHNFPKPKDQKVLARNENLSQRLTDKEQLSHRAEILENQQSQDDATGQ